MKRQLALAVLLPSLLGGCSLFNSLLNSAMDSAGNRVGSAIGDRIGGAVAGRVTQGLMTPELTQAYAMGLFTTLYYYGGYTWAGRAYKPGEYTQWVQQSTLFEKAFLKREADGKEWWRVRSEQQGGGDRQEMTFETLLSAPDARGMQQIVRMRAKFAGQDAAEVPITEENQAQFVLRPTARLSQASLEGATLGWEPVKTPSGLYKARHVRYGNGAGHLDWWLSNEVPGGVLKYVVHSSDKGDEGVMQLQKVGTGATPML